MGCYGDFVYELDWAVGQIIDALERNGFTDNALVIFASDNGPERQTYGYIKVYSHWSMNYLRGLKRDLWEGGHRTPYIISWPGSAPRNVVTDRLVSHSDILATLADYLSYELKDKDAEDSFSFLDEILPGRIVQQKRNIIIHHSANNKLALRKGDWVFINDPSGDNGNQEPQWLRDEKGIPDHDAPYELFNLRDDLGQLRNVYYENLDIAEAMKAALQGYVQSGRTRPLE